MDINEIVQQVQATVAIQDSGIGIEFISNEDDGLVMKVKIYHIDKFLGLNIISKIINKVLIKYGLKLKSLTL